MTTITEVNKGIKRNTVLSEVDFSDKRRKTTMVVDVETTLGAGNESTIFDIGWTVSIPSKKEMVMHRSYIVKEVFLDMKLMGRAHYFNKYSQYVMGIAMGTIELVSWEHVKYMLNKDIQQFNVNNILAYNGGFDRDAIIKTQQYLNENIEFVLNVKCLMVEVVDKVLATEKYVKLASAMGWYTDGGNIKTNAECAYRYISQKYDFVEAHTGLEDSIIETELMWHVHSINGRKDYIIGSKSWKNVKDIAERLNLLGEKKPTIKKEKEWLKLENAKTETIKIKGKTIEVIVTETE